MYYPDEIIEEVRDKNDIVDVISGYVRLQKKGSSYFGLCPFHNEKSPSFSVSGTKQMYYCFGCGAGGNVFTFLMNYENDTFIEAVKVLANRAGVKLPEIEYSEEMKREANRKTLLLEINKEAAKYFYYSLRNKQGQVGHDYLVKRQLTEDTMKQFGLGYANKFPTDLVDYLKEKGYSDELIIQAGLASRDEKHGTYDKFWNRVMFPIQDMNHRVIAFGGRVMGEGEPKYLNSPETDIFDKSRNLYGLNFARSSRKENIILCEGYMDVIAMHQAGFNQAVASLGTAFTSGQASLLRRFTDQVILSYDSDGAGIKAAMRAIGILKEAGLTGKVLDLKPYKDPDEFIINLGAEAFQERINQAKNSFFFEISIIQREFDLSDPGEKTKFHREIAKKLCSFEDKTERDNYLEAIAREYSIPADNLRELVIKHATQVGLAKPIERPKSGIQSKNDNENKKNMAQKMLLTWLCDEPDLYAKIKEYITPEDFLTDLYKKVATKLFEDIEKGVGSPADIISLFENEEEQREVASLFNTKMVEPESIQAKEKTLHDILYTIKKYSLDNLTLKLSTDVMALNEVVKGKKALEELAKTHISLE